MARYIDADELKERLEIISVVADDLYGMGINRGLDRADTEIDMLPTADVVEVVRCEKCEYSKLLIDNENRNHIFRHCRMINAFVKDNSFCSYGVRSEGSGDFEC